MWPLRPEEIREAVRDLLLPHIQETKAVSLEPSEVHKEHIPGCYLHQTHNALTNRAVAGDLLEGNLHSRK